MKVVPRWFKMVAAALAIALSIWAGLHVGHAPAWIALYVFAALASAALPTNRMFGLLGLAVGIAVGMAGVYMLRDAWKHVQLSEAFAGGAVITGSREALVLAVTALWLVVGSMFRTQRA